MNETSTRENPKLLIQHEVQRVEALSISRVLVITIALRLRNASV